MREVFPVHKEKAENLFSANSFALGNVPPLLLQSCRTLLETLNPSPPPHQKKEIIQKKLN